MYNYVVKNHRTVERPKYVILTTPTVVNRNLVVNMSNEIINAHVATTLKVAPSWK